jgi:UDP-N-acetylmuramate dehydrogenase
MQQVLDQLNIRYETDAPLGPLTWYGIGGKARWLVHPASFEQLGAIVKACHEQSVPLRVLGAGANLLVAADVDGVVLQLDDPVFRELRVDGVQVTVGAGYDLFKLVHEMAARGLGGLECLAGIPATVGGAVRMNAGGTYGDIGQSVLRVTLMDETGQVYQRDRDDLVFSYRKSNIAAALILEVTFELSEDKPEELVKRFKEIFMYKKATQPFADHSAGCVFKNPDGAAAGMLIDQAGLKGYTHGGAIVSDQHANFIVAADESCTPADILAVIEHVEKTVEQKHGVKLQRELVVWR